MQDADKRYWISWLGSEFPKAIIPSWPWWIDGWTYGASGEQTPIIVGAVVGTSVEQVKQRVTDARIGGRVKEWRFVEEKPADWTPFNQRYPQQPWMRWPHL